MSPEILLHLSLIPQQSAGEVLVALVVLLREVEKELALFFLLALFLALMGALYVFEFPYDRTAHVCA